MDELLLELRRSWDVVPDLDHVTLIPFGTDYKATWLRTFYPCAHCGVDTRRYDPDTDRAMHAICEPLYEPAVERRTA